MSILAFSLGLLVGGLGGLLFLGLLSLVVRKGDLLAAPDQAGDQPRERRF